MPQQFLHAVEPGAVVEHGRRETVAQHMGTAMRQGRHLPQTTGHQPIDILRIQGCAIVFDKELGSLHSHRRPTGMPIGLNQGFEFFPKGDYALLVALTGNLELHGKGVDVAFEQPDELGTPYACHI